MGVGVAMTESKGKRIPDLDSREAKGMTTMLFSFEGGDAKSSVIRRKITENIFKAK